MAALCVASPGTGTQDCAFRQQRTQRRSRTGLDDVVTFPRSNGRDAARNNCRNANWRYLMHTAISRDKAGKPTPRVCKTSFYSYSAFDLTRDLTLWLFLTRL